MVWYGMVWYGMVWYVCMVCMHIVTNLLCENGGAVDRGYASLSG